jgi:hypothetical protein
MKYNKIVFGLLLVATSFTACNKELDALLTNPNYPSATTADVDLYLNKVQLDFNNFFQSASGASSALARQNYWGGPFYQNAYSPSSFDGIWSTAYSGVIANADAMIPLAQSQKKYIQSGMARIMKAYTYGTLVDMFGDVPYSNAVKGADNTTPSVDGGAAVYTAVQSLLDSAILDLTNTAAASAPKTDLYYGGSAAKWVTLAKTLKLKFYMQARLVDAGAKAKIQALLTENNLINTAANDFQFQYGKTLAPDSRHPDYAGDYNNNGGGGYLSNYFMWEVASEKYGGIVTGVSSTAAATTGDPRLRYYFYRQTLNYAWATESSCPCILNSQYGTATYPVWYPSVPDKTPYCVVGGRGYMGRDHGDNSGGPPDGAYKTQHGIYPAGGEFDYSQGKQVSLGAGAGGNGISPIWLSSFTAFLKAEAVLALGVTADKTDAALLTSGVTQSITKVTGFPAAIGYVNAAIPATTLTSATSDQSKAYIALVDGLYAGAATTAAKLDVLMKEYHIALWGNGIEPYNNLRRTGSPKNVQIAVTTATPGFFMRSFFYPSVFVDRNSAAPAQKSPGTAANKVFWDNNPDNFIK